MEFGGKLDGEQIVVGTRFREDRGVRLRVVQRAVPAFKRETPAEADSSRFAAAFASGRYRPSTTSSCVFRTVTCHSSTATRTIVRTRRNTARPNTFVPIVFLIFK